MIKIICIGKIKENYFKEAISEYKKRISKYTKLEIIELPDYPYDIKKTIDSEYNEIMKVYNSSDYNILLDISGNSINSLEFAKKIDNILSINSNITFIIGGSYGVSDKLRDICNYRFSFSKLTFPHQLFRVILLEQIYRVFKINNNEEYHK
jgi:23S rRNA (pseudouridine1915-N3)-methyltransferase